MLGAILIILGVPAAAAQPPVEVMVLGAYHFGNPGLYGMLAIGDHDAQTGADLNAMWYLRNANIFGKLMQVAKPGDRVRVVYDGGHGNWLRHFAGMVPGYRNIDVRPYLKAAR